MRKTSYPRLPRRITKKWLLARKACSREVRKFCELWPEGVEINSFSVVTAIRSGLSLLWFSAVLVRLGFISLERKFAFDRAWYKLTVDQDANLRANDTAWLVRRDWPGLMDLGREFERHRMHIAQAELFLDLLEEVRNKEAKDRERRRKERKERKERKGGGHGSGKAGRKAVLPPAKKAPAMRRKAQAQKHGRRRGPLPASRR